MLDFIKDKKSCTGCNACVNICPVNCISMVQDEEGFSYPHANEECIDCKKCEKICPIKSNQTQIQPTIKQYSVAALTKDFNTWKRSTSGGAFTEICNSFGDDNTIVFGAKFAQFKVIHTYVIGVKNIEAFRKSKYVQSDINYSFKKAKYFLDNGKKVIFSGTPCQIAGLRSFLHKEYENLLCLDLICHGVGSPKVFREFIKYVNQKYHSVISTYNFREKKIKFGNFKLHTSRYIFINKSEKYIEKDEYNILFLNQLCTRESCGTNCQFRTSNRLGDLTIGDFKNLKEVFPKIKDYKNYSTIIFNSRKGYSLLQKIESGMKIIPCDIKSIKEYNPLFYKSTIDNPLRYNFFNDFINEMPFSKLIEKYSPQSNAISLLASIKDFVPYCLKRELSTIIIRIKKAEHSIILFNDKK